MIADAVEVEAREGMGEGVVGIRKLVGRHDGGIYGPILGFSEGSAPLNKLLVDIGLECWRSDRAVRELLQ